MPRKTNFRFAVLASASHLALALTIAVRWLLYARYGDEMRTMTNPA